ncbi:uncharacterized protein [Hemitrygon akajei]|uniref:uncharacterized protein n=1 Tax=Hemitrygon akajei TaxID=2704970 RepID=UPI003BFA2D57
MAQFYFTGICATTNTGCFGNSAPPCGLNPPPYSEASPPYPTKPQCDGMNATFGYQTNYQPYPQGPSCMPHMPYPNTPQLACVSPQYSNCQRVPAALSMARTIQNVAAPSPMLPPYVNQQSFVSSCVVAQQRPLAPYMANQQVSSTFMVHTGSGVAVSNIASGYPASTRQPTKSLTKEIASAVLTKIIEHESKPKPKYKGNQLTVITRGGSTIIYK